MNVFRVAFVIEFFFLRQPLYRENINITLNIYLLF